MSNANPDVLCVVVVGWDVYRTGNGMPGLPRAQRAMIREARQRGFRAWEKAGRPQFDFPVIVRCAIYRSGKALDTKNVDYGLKPVIDGVFVGRLEREPVPLGGPLDDPQAKKWRVIRERAMLPDDSPQWLAWDGQVEQHLHRAYKDFPKVRFEVRRRPESDGAAPLIVRGGKRSPQRALPMDGEAR